MQRAEPLAHLLAEPAVTEPPITTEYDFSEVSSIVGEFVEQEGLNGAGLVIVQAAGAGCGMGWRINRESGRQNDNGLFGSVPWLDLADAYGAYLVIEADTRTGGAFRVAM